MATKKGLLQKSKEFVKGSIRQENKARKKWNDERTILMGYLNPTNLEQAKFIAEQLDKKGKKRESKQYWPDAIDKYYKDLYAFSENEHTDESIGFIKAYYILDNWIKRGEIETNKYVNMLDAIYLAFIKMDSNFEINISDNSREEVDWFAQQKPKKWYIPGGKGKAPFEYIFKDAFKDTKAFCEKQVLARFFEINQNEEWLRKEKDFIQQWYGDIKKDLDKNEKVRNQRISHCAAIIDDLPYDIKKGRNIKKKKNRKERLKQYMKNNDNKEEKKDEEKKDESKKDESKKEKQKGTVVNININDNKNNNNKKTEKKKPKMDHLTVDYEPKTPKKKKANSEYFNELYDGYNDYNYHEDNIQYGQYVEYQQPQSQYLLSDGNKDNLNISLLFLPSLIIGLGLFLICCGLICLLFGGIAAYDLKQQQQQPQQQQTQQKINQSSEYEQIDVERYGDDQI